MIRSVRGRPVERKKIISRLGRPHEVKGKKSMGIGILILGSLVVMPVAGILGLLAAMFIPRKYQ